MPASLTDLVADCIREARAQGYDGSAHAYELTVADCEWICHALRRKLTLDEWAEAGYLYVGGAHVDDSRYQISVVADDTYAWLNPDVLATTDDLTEAKRLADQHAGAWPYGVGIRDTKTDAIDVGFGWGVEAPALDVDEEAQRRHELRHTIHGRPRQRRIRVRRPRLRTSHSPHQHRE